jgi:2-iminobutanoate/2-iminopropanoate deaminase
MKDVVLTDKAPQPIGPYSQAVKVNGFLYLSGQVAIDPRSNAFAGGGIAEQTERVMENIRAILEAGGSSFGHAVKTTVFLKDMEDFAAMNDVYARYFSAAGAPARSTVQVARLPKDALVEIEVIAVV